MSLAALAPPLPPPERAPICGLPLDRGPLESSKSKSVDSDFASIRKDKVSEPVDDDHDSSASEEDFQAVLAMLVNAPVTPPTEPAAVEVVAADVSVSATPAAESVNFTIGANNEAVVPASATAVPTLPTATIDPHSQVALQPTTSESASAFATSPSSTEPDTAIAPELKAVEQSVSNSTPASTEVTNAASPLDADPKAVVPAEASTNRSQAPDTTATAVAPQPKTEGGPSQPVAGSEVPAQPTTYFEPQSANTDAEQNGQSGDEAGTETGERSMASIAPRTPVANTARPAVWGAPDGLETVETASPADQRLEVKPAEAIRKPAAAPPAAVVNTPQASAAVSFATTSNSTASAAAPSATPVVHQISHAIAAEQSNLTPDRDHSFQMLLDPPELGRILIQMSKGSRGLEVKISAENEAVRSILETSGGDLQQSLQLSQLSTGQFGASMQQHSQDVFRDMLQFDRSAFSNSQRSNTPVATPPASRLSGINMVA